MSSKKACLGQFVQANKSGLAGVPFPQYKSMLYIQLINFLFKMSKINEECSWLIQYSISTKIIEEGTILFCADLLYYAAQVTELPNLYSTTLGDCNLSA